jgi:WD40 repeat protein
MLQELKGHSFGVNSVAFAPDGERLASGSYDNRVRLWDVEGGYTVRVLEGHLGSVNSVTFSPNGEVLASGSNDRSIWLWNSSSGAMLKVLQGYPNSVYAVRFAPNGTYLVATGEAGHLQFWDSQTGEIFLYRYAFGPSAWLDLLPDGRFDASPEGMRYLCYTEKGTLNSYTGEELEKALYDPRSVQEILDRYMN